MTARKPHSYLFIGLGILFTVLFLGFSLVVKKHALDQFDFNTTVRLQDHISRRFDPILSTFSVIGSFEVMTVVLAIILVSLRRIKNAVVFVAYIVAHVIEVAGKSLLHHPGPPFMFFRYDLGFIFPSSYVQTGSSYPSGHSFRTVFLSVLFLFLIHRSKKLPGIWKWAAAGALSVYIAVMLVSRVSLGEHWTTDVIAGSLLALGLGFFSLWLMPADIS